MYSLILLAGGSGSRMQNTIPKQFILLAGKPVIMHILERIEEIEEIEKVIVVCSKEYISCIDMMLKQYNVNLDICYAEAGNTRQESVKSGLAFVDTENVIIHEAARPFVSVEDFKKLINVESKNAFYGIKIPFTVIKGKTFVEGLLNRDELINVQLPQKFDTKLIKTVHEKAERDGLIFTEDASQIYYYYPQTNIDVIMGTEYNIKLTTPMDLITGDLIYKEYFARRK